MFSSSKNNQILAPMCCCVQSGATATNGSSVNYQGRKMLSDGLCKCNVMGIHTMSMVPTWRWVFGNFANELKSLELGPDDQLVPITKSHID